MKKRELLIYRETENRELLDDMIWLMEHCGGGDCNSDWKCRRRRILYRIFSSGEIFIKRQFERFYHEK